jgi:hypothetical protein
MGLRHELPSLHSVQFIGCIAHFSFILFWPSGLCVFDIPSAIIDFYQSISKTASPTWVSSYFGQVDGAPRTSLASLSPVLWLHRPFTIICDVS